MGDRVILSSGGDMVAHWIEGQGWCGRHNALAFLWGLRRRFPFPVTNKRKSGTPGFCFFRLLFQNNVRRRMKR